MEEKKSNVVTYVGGAVIILLLIGLLLIVNSNSKNKKSLAEEKTVSEKLLSEKIMLESELAKLKTDFSDLEAKNNANAKLLEETNAKIAASEKRIYALNAEKKSLIGAKQELLELQKVKADLEQKATQLKSEYDSLVNKSNELEKTIAKLEAEKKDLAMQLDKAMMLNSDNFLVTATRGKNTEKMVVCARRTKKLNVTFDVPQSLTDAISFKIVTPSGETITPDDKAMSWVFLKDSRNLTASLSAVSQEFEASRKVAFSYAATKKLVAGEYKIEIISNGQNIGNCRISLR